MTNEAKELLKREPELCKEIAYDFMGYYEKTQHTDKVRVGYSIWYTYVKEHEAAKDWEILSFKDVSFANGRIYTKNDSGIYYYFDKYHHEWDYGFALEETREGNASIHSVRRLSDNEVFTEENATGYGTIKRFYIVKENEMCVEMHDGDCYPLNCLPKRTTKSNAQRIAEVLRKAGITAEDIINSLNK